MADLSKWPVASRSEEDVPSSGSEGYETADEEIRIADSLSSSKPTTCCSDDSDGYESPGRGDKLVTPSSKPTLRELRELPISDWYLLGLQLKVKQQELERIQTRYSRDDKLCHTKMFGVWRREGDNPSYEKLLRGLVAVGRKDVAQSICGKKGFTTEILSMSSKMHSEHETYICLSESSNQESRDPNLPADSIDGRLVASDVPPLMTLLSEHSYRWRDIGIALGFIVPELQNILSKPALFATAPQSYMQDLLNEWVHWPNDAHRVLPTIEALEAALRSSLVGLGAVSERLRHQLLQKRSSTYSVRQYPVHVPECVEQYTKFLKSKYIDATPLMPTGEWPPNRGRQYSDLTVVERTKDSLPDQDSVKEKRKAISRGQVANMSEKEKVIKSLNDVLDQGSCNPLKVLLEGVPGVGKSTLVRKSCKDWAEGKILQQFQLVLLLTLRDKKFKHATTLQELLHGDDPELKREVTQHLQKTNGEHVLFLLDGFDEVNEEEQSFYLEFLQGERLHKCSIILTSRSSAVQDFKYEEWIQRHVEILGFTEQQAEKYFLQNITDETRAKALAGSLMEEMSSTSVIYTPLNCSILLYIFQQGKFELPNTITELYELFVYSLLKRHSKKFASRVLSLHKCLDTLPEPLKNQFSALCKLAYDGFIKAKFLFSLQDIRDAFQESPEENMEANLLSLLVLTTNYGSHGEESNYQFLHMTIQEYLAARWIRDQPKDEQIKFLSNNWILQRMRAMLVFYAGITHLKGQLFDDFFSRVRSCGYLDTILVRSFTKATKGDHPQPSKNPLGGRSVMPYPFGRDPLPPWGDQKPASMAHVQLRDPVSPSGDDSVQNHMLEMPVSNKPPKALVMSAGDRTIQLPAVVTPPPVATQAFLNIVSMLAEASNNSIYDQLFCGYAIYTIQVGHCRLTTVDCAAIAKFLSKCPNPLKSLHFNFCNLTHTSLGVFHKVSSSAPYGLEKCDKVELSYSTPAVSSALSLVPQIPWFKHTSVLYLHGLQYPEGLHPERFQLHSLLRMENLKDLTLSVDQIPEACSVDYKTVFLKFVKALPTSKSLRRITYNQTPSGTCELFVKLLSVLIPSRLSLTLGHTNIISEKRVTIPKDICFDVCSEGLAHVMKLAHSRSIKSLCIQNPHSNFFLPCLMCQSLTARKTSCVQCVKFTDSTVSFCSKCNRDITSDCVDVFRGTAAADPEQSNSVLLEHCLPSLSSALFLFPKIAWFQHTTVLHLSGLQYPQGPHCDGFQLHSLLTLNALTDLSFSVVNIPESSLTDYDAVFLKFVTALVRNSTLEQLSYHQTPSAPSCESFVQLMSALSHNNVSLTLGKDAVVTSYSVTIPDDACFTMCSKALASAMAVASRRHIKRITILNQQCNLFLPCRHCQEQLKSSTVPQIPPFPLPCPPLPPQQCSTEATSALLPSSFPKADAVPNASTSSQNVRIKSLADPIPFASRSASHPRPPVSSGPPAPPTEQDHRVSLGPGNSDAPVSPVIPSAPEVELKSLTDTGCYKCGQDTDTAVSICLNCSVTLANQSLEVFLETNLVCGNKVLFEHCPPSLPSTLFVLPQIPWFQHTKVLHLHGLCYPQGLHPNAFQLHSTLMLKSVTDLSVSVVIPEHSLTQFESVFLKFVEVLSRNNTLQTLTYDQNPTATCESLVQLMSAMTHCRVTLTLGHSEVVSRESVTIPGYMCFKICMRGVSSLLKLAGNRGITNFNFFHRHNIFLPCCSCRNVTAITTSYQSNNQTSTECSTEDSTRFISRWLSQNKTLKSIDMSGCNANDEMAQYIAGGLCQNRTLEVLKIDSLLLTSEGAVHILHALSQNADFALKSLRILGVESNIPYNRYYLKMSGTSIRCVLGVASVLKALVHASFVNDLVILNVRKEDVRFALEEILTVNQTLRSLRLTGEGVSDQVASCIAAGLAKNHSLKVLNLSANYNITRAGTVQIFKSLESNTSLEELNLSFNDLQPCKTNRARDEDESLGNVVERILANNQTLKSLDLQFCGVDDIVASHIGTGLAENQSLKTLNLKFNKITGAGAQHIFNSLENNTSLQEILLSFNFQLGWTGVKGEDEPLSHAVERMFIANHTALKHLDLHCCGFQDVIATQIKAACTKYKCSCKVTTDFYRRY